MIDTVLLAAGVALLLYVLFKWATTNDNYWAERNVKYLKPYFLVGNTFGIFTSKYGWAEFGPQLYNSFPREK